MRRVVNASSSSSSPVSCRASATESRRFVRGSNAKAERFENDPTTNVPRTPNGANPYVVFEIDPPDAGNILMEAIHKQFKVLANQYHPDRKGGSNELMAELNVA
jgi:hypothetical protein